MFSQVQLIFEPAERERRKFRLFEINPSDSTDWSGKTVLDGIPEVCKFLIRELLKAVEEALGMNFSDMTNTNAGIFFGDNA